MTVSRTGKAGRRAGDKTHKPASRNKRVRVNARLREITKGCDDRPTGAKISQEQWVINVVGRIVGARGGPGFVTADDVISDILLDLLNAGGFGWEEEEIIAFCRKKSSFMVLRQRGRREISECEFVGENDEGDYINVFQALIVVQKATQEIAFEAMQAGALLNLLPHKHRSALEILCDGGTPLDVAEELEMTPWSAIALIREARRFIHRVGPMDEAA